MGNPLLFFSWCVYCKNPAKSKVFDVWTLPCDLHPHFCSTFQNSFISKGVCVALYVKNVCAHPCHGMKCNIRKVLCICDVSGGRSFCFESGTKKWW